MRAFIQASTADNGAFTVELYKHASQQVGKINVSVVCSCEKVLSRYVTISISDIGFIFQSERGLSEITVNFSK